jgi:hypothetical protein
MSILDKITSKITALISISSESDAEMAWGIDREMENEGLNLLNLLLYPFFNFWIQTVWTYILVLLLVLMFFWIIHIDVLFFGIKTIGKCLKILK